MYMTNNRQLKVIELWKSINYSAPKFSPTIRFKVHTSEIFRLCSINKRNLIIWDRISIYVKKACTKRISLISYQAISTNSNRFDIDTETFRITNQTLYKHRHIVGTLALWNRVWFGSYPKSNINLDVLNVLLERPAPVTFNRCWWNKNFMYYIKIIVKIKLFAWYTLLQHY